MKRALGPVLSIVLLLFLSCSPATGRKAQDVEEVFLPDGDGVNVETWVQHLEAPWSLVFLDKGRALVSERPGRIRLIQNGTLREKPYARIEVAPTAEGGLMGLAVHPGFPRQPYIYAMHTYRKQGKLYNRVIRLRDSGSDGAVERIIIDDIPGGTHHDGGRIGFGPDGMLYIATGEIFEADLAQALSSLAGKILRLTPEGGIPADNPFKGSPVYSYGHRNPQGLAWHPETGTLFSSEHGPSGERLRFGHDEINIIVKGGNYGWPEVIGKAGQQRYIDPIVVWQKATPPAGMSFYKGGLLGHLKGDLFVATLRSRSLIRIRLDRNAEAATRIERWFARSADEGKYGRLRDVVEGPDGALYVLSSNRDGRGDPLPGDDTIYRIVPK